MKKYLVFAAAAISAVVSQAASVEWSSGDLSGAVTSHADINGVTAYYYVIDKGEYETLSALTSQGIYERYLVDGGDKYGTKIDHSEDVSSPFYYSSYDQSVTSADLDSDNSVYVAAIYVAHSAFGGNYALAKAAVATFDPSAVSSQYAVPVSGTYDEIAVAAYDSENQWAAVPEPTTIALLALGLAAVGLKRKIA